MRFVAFKIIPIFFVISLIAVIGLGEFVFWRVLKVTCETNETILNNNPTSFVLDGKDQGPFRGERWNKWINKDLSKWYLNDQKFDVIKIENKEENLSLSAWWIGRNHPKEDRTIIIVHGINSSKKQYSQLMPATMLANQGFNVLLFDQRNHGESSCPTGRYFAGTKEWIDLNMVILWLNKEKQIPIDKIGIHAVSGGTLAAQFLMAERDDIRAFSLDSPVFDFEEIVKSELAWNGIPPIIWKLAVFIGKLHGIDIYAKKPKDGISNLNGRALLVFHGTEDTRVPFLHSEKLVNFATSIDQDLRFVKNRGSDHNEALLIEPEVIQKNLIKFYQKSLN